MGGTVLIVDDHAAFRWAATALLRAEGFDVVGEAADGASAVSAARRLQPQIVLLDIRLPDCDGFAVAERLAGDGAPVIVLTSSRSAASFRRRLAAHPSCRFIPKSELSGDAIRAVVGAG